MKRILSLVLTFALALSLAACGSNSGNSSANQSNQSATADGSTANQTPQGDQGTNSAGLDNSEMNNSYVLEASTAAIAGFSYNPDGEETDTYYDGENNAIRCFGQASEAVYTVPDGVTGSYDIYVQLSKSTYAFASTATSITVGDKKHVIRANLNSCNKDFSDLCEMGTFLAETNIVLNAGDTIKITGNPGLENMRDGKMLSLMPAVGNVLLYPTGTPVPVGYGAGTLAKDEAVDPSDPLSGLSIVWLGSSVTFGMEGHGFSMAEAIAEKHPAVKSYKYAVAGTTLVDSGATSYVSRLNDIIEEGVTPDLFIVQLSTNDASANNDIGTVSNSTNMDDFDTQTVVGAIEYIIAFATETWGCPVVFYTGTYYESEPYAAMVEKLLEVQQKWDIGVVDLWNNAEMTAMYQSDQYNNYMIDTIHPNDAGYQEWWAPEFDQYLSEYMGR